MAPKSGRSASKDPKAVEAWIDNIIATSFITRKPLPSVGEIAKMVDALVLTVRNILKEKKDIKERPRKWSLASSDGLGVKPVAIAALYLSHMQQASALKTSTEEEHIEQSGIGVLETRSSAIANQLNKEAGKAMNAYSYFTPVLSLNTKQPHCEYHLFACGDLVVDSAGIVVNGVVLHQSNAKEDWLARSEGILSVLTSLENGYDAAARITTGIHQYLKIANARTDVFAWSKTEEQSKAFEEDKLEAKTDEARPGTIEFIGKATDVNGKVTTVRTVTALPMTTGGFDASSERAYLKSFDKIEHTVNNVWPVRQ